MQSSIEKKPRKAVKSVVFTDAENSFLLQNRAAEFYECKDKQKQMTILTDIEKKMKRAGFFGRDWLDIKSRFINIRAQYLKEAKDKKAGRFIKWKLFDQVDKIFSIERKENESPQEDNKIA